MWVFLNNDFYREGLLAPCPTPKLEDHPSSTVRDCLFNLFAATLLIGGRSNIMAIQDIMWHTRKHESLNGSLCTLEQEASVLSAQFLLVSDSNISSVPVCEAHPLIWCGHRHIHTFCVRQLFIGCLRKIFFFFFMQVTHDVLVFHKLKLDIMQYYKWKQTVHNESYFMLSVCLKIWWETYQHPHDQTLWHKKMNTVTCIQCAV
jgi:hypothetical protein